MSELISDVLSGWSKEDLANLGKLLGMSGSTEPSDIADRFKWLFHSRAVAETEVAIRKLWDKFVKKSASASIHEMREHPSYDALLFGACEYMKASETNASREENELFLSHAVIVAALQGMKPRQRVMMFSQTIDPSKITAGTNIPGRDLGGPATTFALLGAAHASGFGVFAAATTALGFLTHAVGITLPFAVYTGLSSTIAFVIGPVGWLSAGAWGVWKLTQADWKTITRGLVYIIACNSRRQ